MTGRGHQDGAPGCPGRDAQRLRERPAAGPLLAFAAHHSLADEYRRLSDMAITTNEHVDLRLTDLSVRVGELKAQLDQVQRILKEVE